MGLKRMSSESGQIWGLEIGPVWTNKRVLKFGILIKMGVLKFGPMVKGGPKYTNKSQKTEKWVFKFWDSSEVGLWREHA